MPVNRADYPDNWDQISLEVKKAAGWKCEWCDAPHRAVIIRDDPSNSYAWRKVETVMELENLYPEPEYVPVNTAFMKWPKLREHGLTRIIITTAHLDRNTKNNDRENLAALCQRCHLSHDALQHLANRKYGRKHAADHQLKLKN